MGEGGSIGQRQGGFRGLTGKFCSKHGWKVPLGRGREFETRLADGACPRQQGAPEAGCLPRAEVSAMPWRRGVPHWRGAAPVSAGSESSRPQTRDRKLPDGRTNRPRQPSTPSPAPPTVTPRGAAGRKARRRRLTRAAAGPARSRSGGRGAGAPRPGPPRAASFGAL